jgi:hypothetical protein
MEPSKSNDIRQTRRELLIYAAMQLVCLGLTFGVFALLHKLTGKVLLGGLIESYSGDSFELSPGGFAIWTPESE